MVAKRVPAAASAASWRRADAPRALVAPPLVAGLALGGCEGNGRALLGDERHHVVGTSAGSAENRPSIRTVPQCTANPSRL